MLSITATGTKTQATTSVKTFMRVVPARAGWVAFQIEGFGIDPTDEKVTATIIRGATGGTAGSAITRYKADTAMGESVGSLASVLDVFSSEVGYDTSGVTYSLPIAVHPQDHRTTIWVRANAGENVDLRLQGDTGLTSTNFQITAFIRD